MRVARLSLRDFRNYQTQEMRPGPGLNVLVGLNAQGKSNLLEAIYLLATTKSLRAGRDTEMIRSGAGQALVEAEIETEREGEVALDVTLTPGDRKALRINGSRRQRVIELLGVLNAVFFGAIDLGVVCGEPTLRRRFMNLVISQMSPKYCFDLGAYKRVLEQRRGLLKELRDRPVADSGLEVWNDQLAHYGAPVVAKRREFAQELAPRASAIHGRISGGREALDVRYMPNIRVADDAGPDGIAQAFHAQIERVQHEEIRRGATLVGPQRDDLRFAVSGSDARTYGSQGQQRTVVLSLKLAEFELLCSHVGEAPVMLLDDVMSDLDETRRRHLLEALHQRCQTFLTCTGVRRLPPALLREAHIWRVTAGSIEPQTLEEALRHEDDDAEEATAP